MYWKILISEWKHLFSKALSTDACDSQTPQHVELESRVLLSASPLVAVADAELSAESQNASSQTAEPTLDNSTDFAIERAGESELREIVVVDPGVPDFEQLLQDLHASDREPEIVVLDRDRDGIEQISAILESRSDVDALHIVSHAVDGGIKLDNSWLNNSNINGYSGQIASWGTAMSSDADILFYGCDLASGDGDDFLDSIAALTGADVAASNDDTGHEQYGADWELEFATGAIETQIAFSTNLQQNWLGKLAVINVTQTADSVNGDTSSVADLNAVLGDGGDGISLREAILAANAGAGGDTIQLAAGTYLLDLAGSDEDAAATGDLDILQDLTIVGSGAGQTIIDASGFGTLTPDRVFHVGPSAHLILNDLTVTGGHAAGGGDDGHGGGIFIDTGGSSATLERVIVDDNFAEDGAGIFSKGTVTLTDVLVSNNGDELLTAEGGGLHNKKDAFLTGVTFTGNAAEYGGAIHNDNTADNLTLTNATISGNTADIDGGGLYTQKLADITNSTFVLNSADTGGGIHNNGGTVNLANSIVALNTAASSSDVDGSFGGSGSNLIGDGDGSSGLVDGADGNQVGTTASPIDPLIDTTLRFNDGFAPTHALDPFSTAVNAGDDVTAPATDQRGEERLGIADIGAFESQLYAYEPFDYSGSLEGQDGGAGFATEWTKTSDGTSSSAIVTASGLNNPTGGLPVAGGTAEMNTFNVFMQSRDLNTTLGADGTTAWFSYLLKPDGIISGGISLTIGDTSGADDYINVGTNANDFLIGPNGSSSGASYVSNVLVDAQTYFLVVQIDFAVGNDTVTLYVDPTPGLSSPDSVQTTVFTSADLGTFSEIGMIGGFVGNNSQLDEIRVGTSFASVALTNSNVNPIVAQPIANQNATEDSLFNFQFDSDTFDDADDDTLTYTATLSDTSPLPTWLTFTSATRTFSGTPTNDDVGTITVRVTADDGNGGTVFEDFDIVVENTNDDPTVVNSIPDQSATEDSPFSFQFANNIFTDDDAGDKPTFTATLSDSSPLPTWLTFTPLTRTFNGTPTNSDVGTITVRVIATDGSGSSVFDDFDIVISNTNDDPTVDNSIPDQNATEDSLFSFQFASDSFDDVDVGDTLTYSATLDDSSPLPAWLTFTAGTRTFSGTPTNDDVGTITVRVSADDGNGGSVFEDFDIVIGNTNDDPTVDNAIPDQNATEEGLFNFQFAANTFDDADVGDTLTYSATLDDSSPLPTWLTFTSATRTFSGTPANSDVGTITVRVTADDGNGGTVFEDFEIVVSNTNDDPTVDNSIPDQNATEDSPFTFQFASNTFGDVDASDTLTYSATLSDSSPLPTWLTFTSATRTFSGTPANSDVGTITVRVTADDGNGGTVFEDFDIVISNTNDDPTVANSIPDQNATEESLFTFQFAANTFDDADVGDTLTYSATLDDSSPLPTWLTFTAGTRTFSGTPTNDDVGTITVRVTADDGNGGTVFEDFDIVVGNTNDDPTVANAIPDQNATEDSLFSFQFASNTFDDVDVGDSLTYSATLDDGSPLPTWLNFTSGTRTFSGTPTDDAIGTITVRVNADDGNGGSVFEDFDIVINSVNDNSPVADTETVSVVEGGVATEANLNEGLSLLDGDVDLDLPFDTLSIDTAPVADVQHGTLVLNGDGTFTYTHNGSENFTDEFSYRVVDAGGNFDVATVSIIITPVNDNLPGEIVPANFAVDENTDTTVGLNLGLLFAPDADVGDILTYSIVGGTDALNFSLEGPSDDQLILTDGMLDYETKPSYSVTVRATDQASNHRDTLITVFVNDLNEPPSVLVSPLISSLAENTDTSSNIKVADIVVDDDALGSAALSLSGADADSFEIIAGELFVKAGESLDFESQTTMDVVVAVDDWTISTGPEHTFSWSLSIDDFDESPVANDDEINISVFDAEPVNTGCAAKRY